MWCWSIAISTIARIGTIPSSIGVIWWSLIIEWIWIVASHHRLSHHGLGHHRWSHHHLGSKWLLDIRLRHHGSVRILVLERSTIGHRKGHVCWLLELILLVGTEESLPECRWSWLAQCCPLSLYSHLLFILLLLFLGQFFDLLQFIGPELFEISNTLRRCTGIGPIILTWEEYSLIIVFGLFDFNFFGLATAFNNSAHRNKVQHCWEE